MTEPSFGDILSRQLHLRGMTMADLGRVSAIDQKYLSNLKVGLRKPGIQTLQRITKALNLTDDETFSLWTSVGRIPTEQPPSPFAEGREKLHIGYLAISKQRRRELDQLLNTAINGTFMPPFEKLTPSQWPIFLAMVTGASSDDMAAAFGLAVGTIRVQRALLIKTLGESSVPMLAYCYGVWVCRNAMSDPNSSSSSSTPVGDGEPGSGIS